ncbi:DinB family protein [Bacillus aquiflavi]|uniref:DinB family protein n=1 Tax=Bacillus aquiflavi TaxID=2672567 RepID=A0A6B3W0U8_9BACI|nr:DinB family protein [Bacillus aquiflavi]MBA4537881.1 DinB family protein [Bacillus aquiflavi]NEY82137.1 hypothetical protein [Bacillus aquiflavi]UAC48420.1 DinB family protein [Bacillus aquiflavi]
MSNTSQFIQYFLAHRNVTVELVSKIEKEHDNYKPTPTSMSAKELVNHMLYSFHWFVEIVKKGEPVPYQENKEETEANLLELATSYTEKTKNLIESLTDEDLNRTIDLTEIFGQKMNAGQLLQMAMDHEINHKGNLFVYVREMGHTELPMFISK